ncbi:MAG: transposase [Candidatus Nealsonbacteria bacterium]|nr:transposase [Candidatus Nealsonbacteria bacterium]
MPSKKRPPLVNSEIYHIVIRTVEDLKLFRDDHDFLRMIHDLFAFNDTVPVSSYFRRDKVTGTFPATFMKRKREVLVEILAFCLMSNHVHLLVRQLKDDGISNFMRKIGAGYSAYYNQKYKRAGHVFQGRYKIVHITNDNQLKTIFVYIHTNPVAIIYPHWKEEGIGIKYLGKVIQFIEEYRWSSYSDYLGNKNFPSLTFREWLMGEIGGINECRRFINDWLETKKDLADLDKIAIN